MLPIVYFDYYYYYYYYYYYHYYYLGLRKGTYSVEIRRT